MLNQGTPRIVTPKFKVYFLIPLQMRSNTYVAPILAECDCKIVLDFLTLIP